MQLILLLDKQDNVGRTPVYITAAVGNYSMLDYFVSEGFDCAKPSDSGDISLHVLPDKKDAYTKLVLRLVREKRVDVHGYCHGLTFLMGAVIDNLVPLVKLLVEEFGANKYAVATEGEYLGLNMREIAVLLRDCVGLRRRRLE